MSKHATGMTGVGKFMKRWKQRDTAACPCCGMVEDAKHVWLCQGEGADEVWRASLQSLDKWMESVDTDPDISATIIAFLHSWRSDSYLNYNPPFCIRDAIQQQSDIGWNLVLEGWLAKEWELVQQAYYNLIKSRRSGKRWTISIIKKLWQVAWDLWDHRNQILHEKDNAVVQQQLRQLDSNITASYHLLTTYVLAGADRYLTKMSLTQLLAKETDYKKAWLLQASAALKVTRQSNWRVQQPPHRMMVGMRRTLRRWLDKSQRPRSI